MTSNTKKLTITQTGLCFTTNGNELTVKWEKCESGGFWGRTYRRVFGAAGKGYAAFLTTRVRISAVEVDIQIPVISSKSSATLPLQGENGRAYVNHNPHKWTTMTNSRSKQQWGEIRTVDLTNMCSHIPAWNLSGSADQCRLCRPECYC